MKLEEVTAEIRPRGKWESIDLGCALVRENYSIVMVAWFAVVVPMWLGIIALSQLWPWAEGRPWMALLGCWLSVPLTDRVPLFVLSRALFGDTVTGLEVVRAAPRMLWRRWLSAVFFRRLSFNRGLSLPVEELEGLRGQVYRDRVRLLGSNGGEGVTQVILVGWLMILATMFSMLFVYWGVMGLFGEHVVVEDFWTKYVLQAEADFIPVPYVWVMAVLYLIGVTVVEPFVVGAGFAMYVNSRTITEGWDVELAFKRMSKRICGVVGRGGMLMGLLFVVVCGGLTESVFAANERLDKVLADEDFTVHESIEQVPIPKKNDLDLGEVGAWGGGELVFWLMLIFAVATLVYFIVKNSHVLGRRLPASSVGGAERKVRNVMGMEVTPESLPDDLVSAARKAWREGNPQLSLSLLYRGAIAWMVNVACLPISESDTESDCVRHALGLSDNELEEYFGKLTEQWMGLAYGKQIPSDEVIDDLCNRWPFEQPTMKKGGQQ